MSDSGFKQDRMHESMSTPPIPIFIVDDHSVVREGIKRLLQLDGAVKVVGEADSGEEALTKLKFSSPIVVVMDIRLPGMNGIATIREIRTRYPTLRVLVLSAFGNEYLAQAIEAGADGYMLKTTKRAELVDAVIRVAQGQFIVDRDLTEDLVSQFSNIYKLSQTQRLTQRQVDILTRASEGASTKEIAAELSISRATFTRDMRGIFDIFGVDDRAQALVEAYRRGLVIVPPIRHRG